MNHTGTPARGTRSRTSERTTEPRPFVQTSSRHRFPWHVRLFFRNQRRRYGAVLEPARLWARSARVVAFQNLSRKFNATLGAGPELARARRRYGITKP